MSFVKESQTAEAVSTSPVSIPEELPLCISRGLRSVSYFPFLAMRVTAADFNGKEFDGSPLVALKEPDGQLKALLLSTKGVKVEARGCTDYAWFGIPDEYGNVTWAGPGDYIVTTDYKTLKVVPGAFYDAIFHRTP